MSSFRLDEREQARQFAAYFKQLEDRLSDLERVNQLNSASIEGGSLDIYDEDGTLKGSVGVQPDGGVALVPDPDNSAPPPTPTAPNVEPALAGLIIGWDGLWGDAEEAPTDFALVQVHVGATEDFTPDLTTQVATITAVLGGTVTVHIEGYDPVWVRLVAQNTAKLTGEPSPAVQGQPRQAVGQDLIDGIVTEVKLAQDAVTEAKIALNAVSTDKIQQGAITDLLLADDAVTAAKLATGAVQTTALADGAVLAEKLADNAVKVGKIAQDAVTSRELAANSVTAVELAAGSVTANAIAAGSVTTDKLTVVAGSNVLNDPSFEGAYAAAIAAKFSAYVTQDLTFGNGSPASLRFSTNGSASWRAAELALLPCLPGDQLHIGVDYYASTDWAAAAGGEINMQIRWESESGTILSYGKADTRTTAPARGTWSRLQATYTAPANAVRARVRLETGLVTAGTVWFDNAVCRPIVPGVQIADGAITTPKMVAGSIQGDRIAVNTLNADRIVSGSITTSQLTVTTAASILQKFYDTGGEASKWRTGGSSTTTAAAIANLTSVAVPDAQAGGAVMRAVGSVSAAWRPDVLIPFDPNVLYRISAVVRQTVAASDTAQQRFYAGAAGVAADGVTLVNINGVAAASSQHYVAASSQNLTVGGWQRFTGYIKGYAAPGATGTAGMAASPTAPGVMHANTRYLSPIFYANYQGGTGTAEVSSITIEVIETGAVQTVNIADGAITTPKLVSGAVTADKLTALSVTAEKIASLAVTTDKLAALSVTADKLAVNSVTATKIAAGSIDATHIKAGAITADRLALGTDGNLIADPSFEGATSQARAATSTYWSIVTPGNGTPQALQVNAAGTVAETRSMTLATLPATPGQKLWLAIDCMVSADWDGTAVTFSGQWLDAAGNVLGSSAIATSGIKGAWTTLSGVPDDAAPAGTTQLTITCATVGSSAGTVQFDNASAKVVLSSGVAGARAEISPRGLLLYDDAGEEAVALATGRPNYLTLASNGTPVATIDQDGSAGFQSLAVADTLTVAGSKLTDYLDQLPRGLLAIDYQSSSVTSSGSDMGYVELAFTAEAGRMYRTVLDCYADPSDAGGELQIILRDGGANAPLISSPQINSAFYPLAGAGYQRVRLEDIRTGEAWGVGQHRILISFKNSGGPAGQTVRLFGGDNHKGFFYVEDIGPRVPETGAYNTGGGTTTAPQQKWTKTYSASWSGSYSNRSSYNSYYGNKCLQGYYSSTNGVQAALIGFPSSLGTDLAGATILKAEVYLYFDHWYSNAGGKAVIKAHKHTSRPSTFSCDSEAQTISWRRNEGKWVDITSVFDSTSWRGIALDPNSTASTYYGIARGVGQANPPQLRVTFTASTRWASSAT